MTAGPGSAGAVRWPGAVNARHLAGDVYRMGRSEWVTEAGWRQAYDDGVRTVIDLRNDAERRRRDTDPVVSVEAMAPFAVVHCPTEDPQNAEFRSLCGPYLNHPRSYADNLRLFPELIAGVFTRLAVAEGAVVIHCSAGRDRTGMISTMLLLLAGARPEDIARHYELGARGINEWHRVSPIPHPHERHLSEDELGPFLQGRIASLDAFADGLDVERYLHDAGVARAALDAVRARLRREK